MATKKTTASTAAKKTTKKTTKPAIKTSPAKTMPTIETTNQSMGDGMQNKLALVLIGAAALATVSFYIGSLTTKVSMYEKGGLAPVGAAGQQAAVPAGDTAPPPVENLTADQWDEVVADAEFVKGPDKAEVTMVEFTDYQCPFCSRYFDQTYGTIMADYVDTGKVRYITRDLPLTFHENAKPAALAARCAGDQDKYYEMHDKLFQTQESWSAGDPRETFIGYAGELGLNTATFTSCYDSGKYNEAIDADSALAAKMGATGTPTFFINGEKIVGAQPTATFVAALDAALAN